MERKILKEGQDRKRKDGGKGICWNTVSVREELERWDEEKTGVTCAGLAFLGPEREQGELGYRKVAARLWGLLNGKLNFDFPLWVSRTD